MDWNEKLDGFSLDELLEAEKQITSKDPKHGYKEEFNHNRAECTLEAPSLKTRYRLFIRQNKTFPENFSIGLDYYGSQGEVHLIRFNGAHKRIEDMIDNPHFTYHVHIERGDDESMNKIQDIEKTDEYSDLPSALNYALTRLKIINYLEYFSETEQLTLELE